MPTEKEGIMEQNQQVLSIIKRFKECKPVEVFKRVYDVDSGMRFVLMCLSDGKEDVYASTISEKMNISRARVGILLKKMENKNYITRTNSAKDARIEVINITDNGLAKIKQIKMEIMEQISKLINEIGYEELDKFLQIATKIKNVIEGGESD